MKKATHNDGSGIERKLHDPVADKLIPLAPLDLSQITSIDGLVRAMSKTAFTGRQLGEAADVLEAMARDKDCFVVMTLAGAMTVAKQGLIVADLIDRGIVKAIVSTGALMAHGLVEATGRAHFRHNPALTDRELYRAGYDRVLRHAGAGTNLDDVEKVIFNVLDAWDSNETLSSYKLNRAVGTISRKHAKASAGFSNRPTKKMSRFLFRHLPTESASTTRSPTASGQKNASRCCDSILSSISNTLPRLC